MHLNYLEVYTDALEHNARAVVDHVGVPVMGVVKCDGYGVSIQQAALAWQKAGVTIFAVSLPQEALVLRQAGFREDILLMCPVADEQTLLSLQENNIILTVSDLETARFYSEYGADQLLRVHVAVETGMGRFGVRWTDTEQLKAIYDVPGLGFEGIFSHFAKSFEETNQRTQLQLGRFLEAVKALTDAGYSVGIRHIANSCAALRFPETWLDAVRVGSALVGELLAQVPVPLKKASCFKAQVVARRQFRKGDTSGYASVCTFKKPTDAVVVAIGKENGFGLTGIPDPYRLQDLAAYIYHLLQDYFRRPYVMYGDKRLRVVGRIGNQYTLVETAGLDIQPGDYVTARVQTMVSSKERVFLELL